MFNHRNYILIAVSLVILVMSSAVWSMDSLIVDIPQINVIANPSNILDSRALIRFNLPNTLDTTTYVMVAQLRFNVNVPQLQANSIRLNVCPVTSNWSPNGVGWSAPWTNPGGDYADTLRALGYIHQSGESGVVVDVTGFINTYIRGHLPNYGLLIRQTGISLQAFTIVVPGQNNPIAQLAIYYIDRDPDN